MHLNYVMNVIIEGDPFLSKATEYKETTQAALDEWNEFKETYEAYDIAPGGTGLFFSDKSPEGWTKAEGRHGFARPKSGTDAYEWMKSLTPLPKAWSVFGDSLVFDINYEVNGKMHSVPVSELWEGPEVSWNGTNILYAKIPDPVKAIAEIKKKHPDAVILGEVENWKIPTGLSAV